MDVSELEFKMGSNCIVSSAVSTVIGLGSGTHACPRKLEIKGWATELSQKHLQRIKDYQVRVVHEEIEATVPKEARVRIGWAGLKHKTTKDRGRGENDGQFLVFLHCTGIMMMMVSRMVKYDDGRVNGETVRASLELSPQRRPLGKAQKMCSSHSSKPKGTRQRSIQISYFAVVGPLGGGENWLPGQDGWNVHPEMLNQVGAELE